MNVEHRVVAQAPAKTIFAIYKDVEHWHTWDPDTKQATLGGQFSVGARGRLVPTKGNAVPMVLTHVEQDRCFTVECKIPLFHMVFEHELSASGSGTEIVHRATFSGALAFLVGSMLRTRLNAGLPVTLARLKALAEARSVA
jgi:Polyketide cyclase / dehydrase and lipid transport